MAQGSFLDVRVNGDKTVAVISTAVQRGILFIGATMPASVEPGRQVYSFSIASGEYKHDLIALALEMTLGEREGRTKLVPFFLFVDWSQDKPVMKDEVWVPRPDRLGQVLEDHIVVTTPDAVYSSNRRTVPSGHKIVKDANLLCRFLIGRAEVADLEAVVLACQEEATEIEQLRRRITYLERDLSEAGRDVAFYRNEYRDLRAAVLKGWGCREAKRLIRQIDRNIAAHANS